MLVNSRDSIGVPILILDINMGDILHRLTIHEDEDYKTAVNEFAARLNLNHREHKKVLAVVRDQLAADNLHAVDEGEEQFSLE